MKFEIVDKLEFIKERAQSIVQSLNKTGNLFDEASESRSEITLAEAYDEMYSCEVKAEKLTSDMRQMVAEEVPCEAAERLNKNIEEAFPFIGGYNSDGWFVMNIPRLPLCKSKTVTFSVFRESLITVLEHFFLDEKADRHNYDNCVVCYRNLYSTDRRLSEQKDNDNYDYRVANNVIAGFFLSDDNPDICDFFTCSDNGESDCTEITIVPRGEFTEYIRRRLTHSLDTSSLSPHYLF